MLRDGMVWDAVDKVPAGFNHLNGQTTPGEMLAEAYPCTARPKGARSSPGS
jgi:hypothetical protein